MGDFRVRPITDKADRHKMYHYALKDIEAFERMLKENAFVQEPIKIGAEQELCLVDQNYEPSKSALNLLDAIDDPHYTNELGMFNMEINLDPINLARDCFSVTESDLLNLLKKGKKEAFKINEHIVMAGILPTIAPKHLDFSYMTPIPRYETLSKTLHDIRGGKFQIYLQGVDDLIASLGSVLFEACNTSFQLHLQIKPNEFVDKFNWSQMIAGPVLSACCNAPILFGRELWAESRIALFKQSLDTRSSKNHLRKKLPRVYFGNSWLSGSPANLWKNELMRFPLLLTSDDLVDAITVLENGGVPELRAIRLHNGTTYTWNRLCYGPGKKAHLRIECRYLPAGPTAVDEIANFAFWVGLMNAVPENWQEDIEKLPFKDVKGNFIKAARTGLSTVLNWYGKNIPAKELILEILLPMAKKGLERSNIDTSDIEKYLGIIEQRVRTEQTGASWMIKNYRFNNNTINTARQELVAQMISNQNNNIPVHQWEVSSEKNIIPSIENNQLEYTVGHLMSTDIFTVNEDASLDFVKQIMTWKNIHHLPVESMKGKLVGIITDGILKKTLASQQEARYASDIMITELVSVERDTSISEVKEVLAANKLSGVPVVFAKRIIGMITTNDIKHIE
ncbi:MAG: CBS domain-containing protein [Saprospiraceae bacterium]|nr:CBS domain-containing protein [Saprospiraceae bacterium]